MYNRHERHPVRNTFIGLGTAAAIFGLALGADVIAEKITSNRSVTIQPAETATPRPSEASGTPTPTRTPEPTKTPTPEPTRTPRPTATATARLKEQLSPAEAHTKRLIQLDQIWKEKGIEAWLASAGFSGKIIPAAREIETEVVNDNGNAKIVASGIQAKVEHLNAEWPSVMTTDQPGVKSARSFQPDKNNPSTIYTDVTNYTGNATLWVDGQNWRQLAPEK